MGLKLGEFENLT